MVSKHHNIDVELRKNKKAKSFTSSGDVANNCSDSTSEHLKITLFYPVLDAFILELNKRFSFENIQIMQAI